jgi:mannose-6-phosphate isomerase-like protein (cupin superfamily)
MSAHEIAPPLAGQVIGSAGGSFVIAEWRDAGGPAGPPRLIAPPHVHHSDDEAWYVLEGTLCVHLGEKTIEARAGSAVFAPRGTPHTFWNPDAGLTRYLLVMTPNIYRLIQEIHATHDRSVAVLSALFRKYDSELVGSLPGLK